MSLLMDALKQAEHAKRDKPAEPPAVTPAPEPVVRPSAELSLAPAEPHSAPASDLETDAEPPAVAPAPAQQQTPLPAAVAATATPAPAATGAQAAARILAAGANRQAAERRRNLLGIGALAGVLALAIGGYYHYAALAQSQPFMSLPPAAAPLSAEPSADDAALTTADAARDDSGAPGASDQAISSAPAQTPWRAGPPPTALVTEDWQPAPVDPRVLRGDAPVEAAEAPTAATPAPVIRISRGSRPDRVSAALQDAYAAFRAERWAEAELGYRDVLAREAGNRDALLGLAALAVRAGRPDVARQHYRELLRRDPKDAAAYAGLVELDAVRGAGSESELKLRLAEQPRSAALHFALANLYASQQRWPLAQQAYFEAQRLAPDDPDYAFNLAVSLEHLGQPQPAQEYYRRALRLGEARAAQFDADAARRRIAALDAAAPP